MSYIPKKIKSVTKSSDENPEEFAVVTNTMQFEKRPIPDILEDAKTVDPKKIASEVVGWAITNVENYIDNEVRIFKLDLVLDAEESMPETKKIQDLHRAIPNDEDLIDPEILDKLKENEKNGKPLNIDKETEVILDRIHACREELDKIVEEAFNEIQNMSAHLEKLSERLIYYYEMKGIKDGKPLIQDMVGSAKIIRFVYEAFNVGVRTREPVREIHKLNGEVVREGGEVVHELIVPEGFALWIEVAMSPKRPQTMF